MKKSIFIIIGGVVLAVLLAAGSFYGGMAYQRTQTNNVRNNFLASRGLNGANGTGNFTGAQGAFAGGLGRGAQGTIKSINGNTITITSAQGTDVTVTMQNSTVVLKTTSGASSDLVQGDRVAVTGQRDSSGNMTATQILIEPAAQAGQ